MKGYTAKKFRNYSNANKYKTKLNRDYGMKQSVLQVKTPRGNKFYVVVKPTGIKKIRR